MKGPARLRIAMMLESDGPGGAETMVFRLSEQLRERGHTVVPVGLANGIGWLGDLYRNSGVVPELFPMACPIKQEMQRECVKNSAFNPETACSSRLAPSNGTRVIACCSTRSPASPVAT